MSGVPFLDTNVLLYAALQPDPRSDAARALLAQGGIVSVQVLNEFVAVARRKLRRPWPEITQALVAIRTLCPPPLALSLGTHDAALEIAARTGYQIYDALILAAALEAGCATLLSEDLQDGQVIDGRLTLRNPFRPA
ncbi:PIN domain-containing protein [Siccirubricoccus sp. G192]|uniref:PIN domain-containing protein n=1 Tax=Siccirubricoccus sp. G192 TaxID=2849651 RepID=UPI001C2C79AF|nr:PIN domain-containing protein [Siccirubricoccus sp. G192]MBV1800603.1 PIN domain-containing protein [Siccirubricoccus sp. G192]MBV1800667.1 PIN domain-containing protein [Siccirubricoccus sp. G192]